MLFNCLQQHPVFYSVASSHGKTIVRAQHTETVKMLAVQQIVISGISDSSQNVARVQTT